MSISLGRALLISLALAVFLAGCGGSPTSTSSTPSPTSGLTITPPGSPTATITPGPLPSDIPVYPKAQLLVTQYIATGVLYYYVVIAPLGDVASFFTSQMPGKGWTQQSKEEGSQGNLYVYTKDTRSVMLSVAPDPNMTAETDISITLSNS